MNLQMTEIDISRIQLLTKNFGWELVEKKVLENEVQIVLEKELQQIEEGIRDVFWVRLREVLQMFGWDILEETTEDNLLSTRAKKALG